MAQAQQGDEVHWQIGLYKDMRRLGSVTNCEGEAKHRKAKARQRIEWMGFAQEWPRTETRSNGIEQQGIAMAWRRNAMALNSEVAHWHGRVRFRIALAKRRLEVN